MFLRVGWGLGGVGILDNPKLKVPRPDQIFIFGGSAGVYLGNPKLRVPSLDQIFIFERGMSTMYVETNNWVAAQKASEQL